MSDATAIQEETQEVPAKIKQLRWSGLRRRMGKFKIAEVMAQDDMATVFAIMGECFVTRCEHRWDSDVFEYLALSWQFRELSQGDAAPEYVWYKNKDDIWTAREEVTK